MNLYAYRFNLLTNTKLLQLIYLNQSILLCRDLQKYLNSEKSIKWKSVLYWSDAPGTNSEIAVKNPTCFQILKKNHLDIDRIPEVITINIVTENFSFQFREKRQLG